MDFLSPEPLNLVAAGAGAQLTPLSTANLPPNPQEPAPERAAGPQDDPLAPGWIPNRRPMYLGVSSVPLPRQPPPAAAAATAAEAAASGAQWAGGAVDAREVPDAGAQPRGDAGVPPYPPFMAQPEAEAAAGADAAYRRISSRSLSGANPATK